MVPKYNNDEMASFAYVLLIKYTIVVFSLKRGIQKCLVT